MKDLWQQLSHADAVVCLNGELSWSFIIAHYQQHLSGKPIYCADGAWSRFESDNPLISYVYGVIGDGDSCGVQQQRLVDYIHRSDQNQTDFEKTLEYAVSQGCQSIIVYGASGREMDHFLGNISVAVTYLTSIQLCFVDQYHQYGLIESPFIQPTQTDQLCSLMPITPVKQMTSEGLVYPLDQQDLNWGALIGIRNRAKTNQIMLKWDEGLILFFLAHDHKR